jgi:8-oxo-dGTP diphosphatase
MNNIEVKIYDIGEIDDNLLKYAVISARYNNKWIFCRHRERDTWEIPGGHREKNENILDTAKRELKEETGAIKFDINTIAVYSVRKTTEVNYGKLFFAEVKTMDVNLKFEIEEIELYDDLPVNLTYPEIQPALFKYAKENSTNEVSINTVPMVTIFLERNDSILMLKRSTAKKIAPGKWTGIGGHIEEYEYKEPFRACLREMEEETGLKEKDVKELKLRYYVLRNLKNETLRQQFVYFGKTDKDPLFYEFREGSLHWIEKQKVFNLDMVMIGKYILKHYLQENKGDGELEIGVATYVDGTEKILWNKVVDFDKYK